MKKTLYAASCLAILGTSMVLAMPSRAETTPPAQPPMGTTETPTSGMPMGGPMGEQMMKMREENIAMRQKMDTVLEALQKDQAQLKSKGSDKALLAKLDKDLTDLQEAHKHMRTKGEHMREMMGKHRQMMPGASGAAPAPTPEPAPAKE